MKKLSTVGWTLMFIAILRWGGAIAQLDQAISGKDLVDPWMRAKAVVLSLAPLFDTLADHDKRSQIDSQLSKLDDEVSKLQSQQENLAIRIVSNPAFVYDASLSSTEMSEKVSDIEKSFDSLFRDLMVRERPDLQAIQESLASLRQLLSDKNRFERDVIRAVASGSKNQIQALAGQWWDSAESVGSVREAISDVRRKLAASPSDERRN